MEHTDKTSDETNFQKKVDHFVKQYGQERLEWLMQHYADSQDMYICKTRSSTVKIRIADILYIEIREHNIFIHTEGQSYTKYGTLNSELVQLSPFGFVKCNRSVLVSIYKIIAIEKNELILVNKKRLRMSRGCASIVSEMYQNRGSYIQKSQ